MNFRSIWTTNSINCWKQLQIIQTSSNLNRHPSHLICSTPGPSNWFIFYSWPLANRPVSKGKWQTVSIWAQNSTIVMIGEPQISKICSSNLRSTYINMPLLGLKRSHVSNRQPVLVKSRIQNHFLLVRTSLHMLQYHWFRLLIRGQWHLIQFCGLHDTSFIGTISVWFRSEETHGVSLWTEKLKHRPDTITPKKKEKKQINSPDLKSSTNWSWLDLNWFRLMWFCCHSIPDRTKATTGPSCSK